jgi:oxygen-independent coproporphyrinogen-3 oxidase
LTEVKAVLATPRHSDAMNLATAPVPTEELLRRFDIAGPRYTSYPTADRFGESFGEAQYREALGARAGSARAGQPLSLYVHIPFCESVCYYCACNKVVTRHHERAAPYLDALEREMALQAEALGARRPVSQLHFGGGSPTFLCDAELTRTMRALREHFDVRPDAEISIEVDPRTVDAERLAHLAALGFNRLSFGVQDFDPDVQQAVHRVQSLESVRTLVQVARRLPFASINVDLIYGLPRQTRASFARTVAQVGALRPDRIALYGYAHLPLRFAPQRRIDARELPRAEDKIGLLAQAIAGFVAHGYVHVAMDHFALPGDSLEQARRSGRLQRNFQGYSTQPDCDLIGLGVSAIGTIGAVYAQNAKALADYQAALAAGRLAVERGLALDAEDLLRRDVIMGLMCQGRVAWDRLAADHGVADMRAHFAREFERLAELERCGLVRDEPEALHVTPLGWTFVRALAMVFDARLGQSAARPVAAPAPGARYSRIL